MQREEIDKLSGGFIGCQLDDSVLEAVVAETSAHESSILGIIADYWWAILAGLALVVSLFIL